MIDTRSYVCYTVGAKGTGAFLFAAKGLLVCVCPGSLSKNLGKA